MKLSRLLAAPVIAGVMMLTQAVGVGPAHADTYDLACHYDHITFNACLNFQQVLENVNQLDVRVGLDASMPQGYAQEIVSHGAGFRASLWGDDNGRGQFLADLTLAPGSPTAGPAGLTAALYADGLYKGYLDEDLYVAEDEIYAVVSYFDYHQGVHKTFRTGIVHGDFSLVIGGGGPGLPNCLILC
jgi:hypothetical protein